MHMMTFKVKIDILNKRPIIFLRRDVHIMELVFFYVVKSESGFIENTGFNFSPNYKFCVEYDNKKKLYTLKQEKCKNKLPHNFFDEDGCITNVTAIVGENGSGKTTLLNALRDYSLAYEKKLIHIYNRKFISIYSESNELFCYHNIFGLHIDVSVNLSGLYSVDDAKLNFVSRIYVTNSSFSSSPILKNGPYNEASMNNVFTYFRNCFFNPKLDLIDSYPNRKLREFNNDYYFFKNNNIHQGILDSLYLTYVIDNNLNTKFLKNIKKCIKIEFDYFASIIGHRIATERDSKDGVIFVYESIYLKLFDIFYLRNATEDCVTRIYLNFLFELLLCIDDKSEMLENFFIKNKNDLCDCIKNILDKFLLNSDIKQYYINGFNEICEFDKLVENMNLFPSDISQKYVLIDLCNDNSKKLLEFLYALQSKSDSYILKYLNVTSENLASGERALLNFYSHIFLVSVLVKSGTLDFSLSLDFSTEKYVYDNVILLIDEIDLYCHPSWQQKLLKYLIEGIKSFFIGKKVQIIFSTHSPIVLSDLPRSNIIFLERKNDKCSIYEDNLSNETFGANIYKLFDDAFFLEKKGQIGEFAREKIQGIIDKIKPEIRDGETIYPELSFDEIYNLEQQISLIGEPIIRDKLFDMLYKNYPELAIKKKIQRYEAELKKLHNLKNGGSL